jgi:hypothetical protein
MTTKIRRSGLGSPEPDIGKEDARGEQAVGRRSSVGGEDVGNEWDAGDTADEAPVGTGKPAKRSERDTDRGWG